MTTSAELRVGIDAPLDALRGIGPARAGELAAAGYRTVRDLLLHVPARFEDRRRAARVGTLSEPGSFFFTGRLVGLRRVRVRRRGLSLVRGWLDDGSGRLPVLWFNRPYLAGQVRDDRAYHLYGAVRAKGDGWELVNPTCEAADPATAPQQAGRVVPLYPAIGTLGPGFVRRLLGQILDGLDLAEAVADPLPAELRERHGLPALGEALAALHRPGDGAAADDLNRRCTPAHARLAYGELLELQVEMALLRELEVGEAKPHAYLGECPGLAAARDRLPFALTAAQERVVGEILDDLRAPRPMLRLLQGDVGSGKTVVALLALVLAMESGLQGAVMAPTELLAEQHFRSLSELLGGRYRTALLTATAAEGAAARRDLARGRAQLVVGTHALIQEGVRFRRLGLAVVDEQHRFGVAQRQALLDKGERPDLLVMTATPIPRSLALTAYGDLALSVLDELPPGRRPVATRVLPEERREAVYSRLRSRLAAGGRAYVVLPRIDADADGPGAIASTGEWARRFLAGHESAILHGRLGAAERDEIMRRFAAGEVQVLIATTVIEVGVDVPEATVMVIESAERFGLAQLHQLRGRVGRGREAAWCVALHGPVADEARARLEVFAATYDGFEIADADLALRGPGDLLGSRQAGLPRLRCADLVADRVWLERARRDARELVAAGTEGLVAALVERAAARHRSFAGG